MKTKSIFVLLLAVVISGSLSAQPRKRLEKIKSQKVAFITQELNLSVEEAQHFWPVYNELNDKLDKIRIEKTDLYKDELQGVEGFTEEKANEIVDKYMELEFEEASLKKEYHEKFKKVLPAEKVLKLYIAENKFKIFLLNRLKDKNAPLFGY